MMKSLRKIGSLLYDWWMRFARALAFVNTRVLLTIFYVLVIGPIALVLSVIGKDFLERKIDASLSYWKKREPSEHTLESASRQF
jgi:hypothetical protein